MISAGRKCVLTIDVPPLALEQVAELGEVELLDQQPQRSRLESGSAGLVHLVVEVAQDVRGLVDQVEVRLAVELAERGVGQREDVDVADHRVGRSLPQRQFDRLRRPEMAGTHRRTEYKHACGHVAEDMPAARLWEVNPEQSPA